MLVFTILVILCLLVLWSYASFGYVFSSSVLGFFGSELVWEGSVDSLSSICLLMLFCCGYLALYYCHHYFSGGLDGFSLFPIMVWFLGVMAFLILSASPVLSLVLWEYLGLVSFFLILFYSNGASLRASLITLFVSRFGDAALFLIVMWFGSWSSVEGLIVASLLLLVILTKSACYPFVSWLLEAMRAPTPVSSLVHSSTLVAAGVWFLLRYNYLCSSSVLSFLYFLALLTILISGVSACCFDDLKKTVALSTCNNVSWCLVFFICGDLGLALLQLLTHGVCKCYLFMSVGDLMSQSGSSQSAVGVYNSRYSGSYGVVGQGVLVFSLCGLPYLGVFFSKHGLFGEFFYSFGSGSVIFMMIGFLLSCVYSTRFALLLVGSCSGLSLGYSSSFVFTSVLAFFGTVVNYLGGYLINEEVSLGCYSSAMLLGFQVFGCFIGGLSYLYGFTFWASWSSLLWGGDGLVNAFYSIFGSVSGVGSLAVYRWERYLFGLFPGGKVGVGFSLNFMVFLFLFLGGLFVLLS